MNRDELQELYTKFKKVKFRCDEIIRETYRLADDVQDCMELLEQKEYIKENLKDLKFIYMAKGEKIPTIKKVRERLGCSLKEAKDIVDSWEVGN